ncbi:MAG: HAD-IIIA family hydrolase [Candidatus Poseidoniaceae archaeon]|nr:HAD-IIIA family hydrolase [Candidatus Poseidoniaceae archaeon]
MRGVIAQITPHISTQNEDQFHGGIAFLDRDGVLNIGYSTYVNSPQEVKMLPGAGKSIATLRQKGWKICIVTNQSPIMRGLWNEQTLHEINDELRRQLLYEDEGAHVDVILACPHRSRDRCACRKPYPGMLFLGSEILRNGIYDNSNLVDGKGIIPIDSNMRNIDWWGVKTNPPHRLDLMLGDRKCDLGVAWAYGARSFRANPEVGIVEQISRMVDEEDEGISFKPVG